MRVGLHAASRSLKRIASLVMAVMKRRSRLVSFRVSTDEHEALTRSCAACNARSFAEFARAAVLRKAEAEHAPGGKLSRDITTLSKALGDLDARLVDIRRRIRGVLGPVGVRPDTGLEEPGTMHGK